jgi:hypothetical protein
METPYEGAEARSVVLTPTAGHTEMPCLGLRITSTTRAMEEHCTLQISCFHDEQEACRSLADKVNQALFDHAGDLERVYDIHNLRRTLGPIPGPVDIGVRESHILMAFQFYTHRAVT